MRQSETQGTLTVAQLLECNRELAGKLAVALGDFFDRLLHEQAIEFICHHLAESQHGYQT